MANKEREREREMTDTRSCAGRSGVVASFGGIEFHGYKNIWTYLVCTLRVKCVIYVLLRGGKRMYMGSF